MSQVIPPARLSSEEPVVPQPTQPSLAQPAPQPAPLPEIATAPKQQYVPPASIAAEPQAPGFVTVFFVGLGNYVWGLMLSGKLWAAILAVAAYIGGGLGFDRFGASYLDVTPREALQKAAADAEKRAEAAAKAQASAETARKAAENKLRETDAALKAAQEAINKANDEAAKAAAAKGKTLVKKPSTPAAQATPTKAASDCQGLLACLAQGKLQ